MHLSTKTPTQLPLKSLTKLTDLKSGMTTDYALTDSPFFNSDWPSPESLPDALFDTIQLPLFEGVFLRKKPSKVCCFDDAASECLRGSLRFPISKSLYAARYAFFLLWRPEASKKKKYISRDIIHFILDSA